MDPMDHDVLQNRILENLGNHYMKVKTSRDEVVQTP